jgi:signal recognition particle GTPase
MSLYENINKKRKRIAAGSGEKMRKKGSKGAPTAKNFAQAKKTAKKPMKKTSKNKNKKNNKKAK